MDGIFQQQPFLLALYLVRRKILNKVTRDACELDASAHGLKPTDTAKLAQFFQITDS